MGLRRVLFCLLPSGDDLHEDLDAFGQRGANRLVQDERQSCAEIVDNRVERVRPVMGVKSLQLGDGLVHRRTLHHLSIALSQEDRLLDVNIGPLHTVGFQLIGPYLQEPLLLRLQLADPVAMPRPL